MLSEAFIVPQIQVHFDWMKEVVMETDTTDCVSAGVLFQREDNWILQQVAFYWKKQSPAETNYEIYDK